LTLSGVETSGESGAFSSSIPRGEAMEDAAIRTLIRQKLQDRRLPLDGIPRWWVGPSEGEECNACDRLITGPFVVEGIAGMDGFRKPIQLHVNCFALWDEERREPLN
jgi:hypothetical protein